MLKPVSYNAPHLNHITHNMESTQCCVVLPCVVVVAAVLGLLLLQFWDYCYYVLCVWIVGYSLLLSCCFVVLLNLNHMIRKGESTQSNSPQMTWGAVEIRTLMLSSSACHVALFGKSPLAGYDIVPWCKVVARVVKFSADGHITRGC